MNKYLKRVGIVAITGLFLFASCSESKTNKEETTVINSMDSTTKVVKETTEKLEEQTKKVEESLEKLDKEFQTN